LVTKDFNPDAKYYQFIYNRNFVGCGEDVNPPTDIEMDLLLKKVTEIGPEVIGISARSIAVDLSRKLVGKLRSECPKARYLAGGYGPTMEPEIFLQFIDYVCLGEGEKVIDGLVSAKDPCKLPNVAWLEQGKLRWNPPAEPVNLDTLPFPDWGYNNKFIIEDDLIRPIEECYDTYTYDIFASRGCPNTCTYCLACQWDSIYRQLGQKMPKIRIRSPKSVINELLMAKKNLGIKYVRFKDSIFGFRKKWFYEFMDLYDKKIGLPFNCLLEDLFIDEKRIERLRQSGLKTTTVGIQGVNERIRREILGRRSTNDEIVAYAQMLRKNDVGIKYDIIHWNPFDTKETLKDGIKFLKRLPKGEDVVIFQLKRFPLSKLDHLYKTVNPKGLSFEEYEYYAWVYQMILRSEETERIADFVSQYEAFKKYPRILKWLMDEEVNRFKQQYKIVSRRDITAGELITNVMIERSRLEEEGGILWEDRTKILARKARKIIEKGSPLNWDDVFGSYDHKGEEDMILPVAE
jgi:radical SAM superfamily enzyme YgiQ (UPF0313 family)